MLHTLIPLLTLAATVASSSTWADQRPPQIIHVNAKTGTDRGGLGENTEEKPYRTIDFAIQRSLSGDIIQLAPQVYTLENPLVLDNEITLRTHTASTPATLILKGTQSNQDDTRETSITIRSGSLTNLIIKPLPSTYGTNVIRILPGGFANLSSIQIRANERSANGISIGEDSRSIIKDSSIQGNAVNGIIIEDGAISKITNTIIKRNYVGIKIMGSPQLQISSTITSPNQFINNTGCNIFNHSDLVVSLNGSTFKTLHKEQNEDFRVRTNCINGNNFASRGVGTITMLPLQTENPIFFGTTKIPLISPTTNLTITTQTPNITWQTSNPVSSVAAIFKAPPRLEHGSIKNWEDIAWLWHSGLNNASAGFVPFSSGIRPLTQDLTEYTHPRPLEKGTSYYVAVWSWNDSLTTITSSSAAVLFHVHPSATR